MLYKKVMYFWSVKVKTSVFFDPISVRVKLGLLGSIPYDRKSTVTFLLVVDHVVVLK